MRDKKVGGSTFVDRGAEVAAPVPGRQSLVQQLIGATPVEVQQQAAPKPAASPQPRAQLPSYASILRLFGGGSVQAKGGTAGAPDVHAAAAQGISGPASSLPHLERIQRSFGKHDVSHVQAHTGSEAKAGAEAMGAQAFATGHHVAFSGTPSLHTAAHEAAHVVQQSAGVQLAGGVGAVGDTYEQHADQVADLVVRGESAEAVLDQHAGGGGAASLGVQRQQGKQEPPPAAGVERLIHLLTTTRPRPEEQTDEAFAFLATLDMPALLDTISGAADRGLMPQLIARSGSATWFGRAKLLAAIFAVDLAHAPTKEASDQRLHRAGLPLDQLPQEQQLQVLEYLLRRNGSGVHASALFEGMLAMREQDRANSSSAAAQAEPGAGAGSRAPIATASMAAMGPASGVTMAAGTPGTVGPGPWNPPGRQPIPFYIGNEAHKAIADEYLATHAGDVVRANYFPISSILGLLKGDLGHAAKPEALSETELGLEPDIVNLSRLHLYEIKPLDAQALGATKAKLCVGLFGRAGVAMQLGPMGEPGTSGGVSAPDGVYMFWSPEPGVIVYQYRKGKLVPVPVPAPEPSTERRWRFELQPMSPQQKQAIATLTVGTALLMIAMILLSPVGI